MTTGAPDAGGGGTMLGVMRHRSAVGALLVLALAALCSAARAGASDFARVHGTLVATPVLRGEAVVGLFEAGAGTALREVDPVSGTVRQLATLPSRFKSARVFATPSMLAVQGQQVSCSTQQQPCRPNLPPGERNELIAYVPGAGPQCVFGPRGCLGPPPCDRRVAEAVVAGTTVAYPVCGAGGEAETELVDIAAPGAARRIPQVALPEALAGNWLVGLSPGWLEPGGSPSAALVEVDLADGQMTARIPVRPTRSIEETLGVELPALAAVEADGRVALVLVEQSANGLWLAGPGEPSGRRLAPDEYDTMRRGNFLGGSSIWLAGGQIALSNGNDSQVRSLTGSLLGRLAPPWVTGFDFDGAHGLFAATPCAESYVARWRPEEPEPALPFGRCPAPRPLRATLTHRGIKLLVSCAAREALGCPRSKLILMGGNAFTAGGFIVETGLFSMPPGTTRTISVGLGRNGRRWFADPRHRSVEVIDGAEDGGAGTREEQRFPNAHVPVTR